MIGPRPVMRHAHVTMDEFKVIDRYFARHGSRADGVALGVGDDGAVVEINDSAQLVIATDTVNVGTHFPAEMPSRALGHRCLAVNLSDLAAMGAEPLWCTLALSMPVADAAWLDEFSAGFFTLAERFGVTLIGGDTVRGPLSATVTVHGRVPRNEFVARHGACPGDRIYITGTPGEAAAGLQLMGVTDCSIAADALRHRFCYPEPRLAAGQALRGVASAMIDVSDGLHVDLSRLARASDVGAELDVDSLPLSDHLLTVLGPEVARQSALSGGDDYELCFAAPSTQTASIAALASSWDFAVTQLGTIVQQPGVSWLRDDVPYAVEAAGFEHFSV